MNNDNSINKNVDDMQFDETDLDNLEMQNIFNPILDNIEENKKSIGWKINQISKLTIKHSIAYIGKFLFLNIIVLLPSLY